MSKKSGAIGAFLGAVGLALVGVVSEALWRPAINFILYPFMLNVIGEDWVGIEVEALAPPKGARQIGGCLVEDRNDLKRVPARLSEDTWKVLRVDNNLYANVWETEDKTRRTLKVWGNYSNVGGWIIANITMEDGVTHDVLYLKQNGDRFEGFETAYDCHGSELNALLCPYMLVKGKDSQGLRAILDARPKECQYLDPSVGLPRQINMP